jgi:hypothetical protein
MHIGKLAVLALPIALAGFASDANAQVAKLFFESDIVRGAQQGAPGPFCVLANQFKRLEKVVFRARVVDQDGKALDDKGLKSVVFELPDGQNIEGRYGPHPPPSQGPATDHFWAGVWIIPTSYPSGTFAYKVTATSVDGKSQTWEPFKRVTSQLQVVAGEIEIRPPAAGAKK